VPGGRDGVAGPPAENGHLSIFVGLAGDTLAWRARVLPLGVPLPAGKTVKELVSQARSTIDNLSAAELARELERPDAVLVDLREPGERAQHGTIPGALAAPRGMLEFYADPSTPYHRKELDPGRRVLLYCASGGRSALAGAALRQMGFARVAHLDGGFKAWKEAGFEVAPAQE